MLTAELVRVRKDPKTRELRIARLDDKAQGRALELAETLLSITRAHVGRSRDELEEALAQVRVAPRERLLCEGLRKLIDDRCEFDVAADIPPDELRGDIFSRAAAAWRAGAFSREAVVAEVAAARGVDAAAIERGLYADLRGAHRLADLRPVSARGLVLGYDMSQAQAVLLRAVRVAVDVRCEQAAGYRALFRKLKFLRLLFAITARGAAGYHIEIDGPFSLFESVTKYGLQLSLLLPAIAACDSFELVAEVRWGKEREPWQFRLEGGAGDVATEPDAVAPLPDEVDALLRGFSALSSQWEVSADPAVLHLPGVGVCVPDLLFVHRHTGQRVLLEVLGYWSRDAVWRRVELVERGMAQPLIFAVSSRLRVSEQALGDDLPAALYVYKGVISPRSVLERLEAIRGRLAGK